MPVPAKPHISADGMRYGEHASVTEFLPLHWQAYVQRWKMGHSNSP